MSLEDVNKILTEAVVGLKNTILLEKVVEAQKDMAKEVKKWAVKKGIKNPRVKSIKGKTCYIQLQAYKDENPDGISSEVRKELVKFASGGTETNRDSYGNISKHIVAMSLKEWSKFLGISLE